MMRCDFQKLPGQLLTGETTLQEEMEEYLNRNGYRLSVEQTVAILKEYFNVEVGDYILTTGFEARPGKAEEVKVNERVFFLYQVAAIVESTLNTLTLNVKARTVLLINAKHDMGQGYPGGTTDTGIFIFFLSHKYVVIKGEVVNAMFT